MLKRNERRSSTNELETKPDTVKADKHAITAMQYNHPEKH